MDLVAIFGNADKDKVLLTNLSSKGGGRELVGLATQD